MLQNPLEYDSAALKASFVQRHGSDLGSIVFDAEVNRRRAQDARAAELTTELSALHANISNLSQAAGDRRAKSQVRLAEAYSAYLAMCDAEAQVDAIEQAKIAPMTARSMDIQQQMRSITQPRLSEREMQTLAMYSSANAERLRSVDKRLPPINPPPLSELARINASVGLQKPRS